jgi:hypothetical protein
MAEAALGPTQEALIRDVRIVGNELSIWGVPRLDDEGFHGLTESPPNGFTTHVPENGSEEDRYCLEWFDPYRGGVAVVFETPIAQDEFSTQSHLPDLMHDDNPWREISLHEAPNSAPLFPDRLVGLQAIHCSPDLSVVQLPGIDDYLTAYEHLNDGQTPVIMPVPSYEGDVEGRKFTRMLNRGQFPFNMHFVREHLALAIGGPALEEYVQSLASQLTSSEHFDSYSDEVLSPIVTKLDLLATFVHHIYPAKHRVQDFKESDDLRKLYEGAPDYTPIPEVAMRFNAYAADHLGIQLPDYSWPKYKRLISGLSRAVTRISLTAS